jgi:Matrixin
MKRSAPLALVLLASAVLHPSSAQAYVARRTESGQPVHWDAERITLVVDPSISAIDPEAITAVTRAFAAWGAVSGASAPEVVITEGAVDEVGYRSERENRNTLRYLPSGYEPAGRALAITLLSFDDGGRILDADIVISGGSARDFAMLAADGTASERGPYDLENVLTHEAGHLFGLAHNDEDADVTMYFSSARGETKKRDLAGDDEDGLRFLYPETAELPASCSATSAPRRSPDGLCVLAAPLALAGLRGKRRRDVPSPR